MKLYLISRTDSVDYDEYDSFVVSAENIEDAIKLCNEEGFNLFDKANVEVTELSGFKESQIILSSFNAG